MPLVRRPYRTVGAATLSASLIALSPAVALDVHQHVEHRAVMLAATLGVSAYPYPYIDELARRLAEEARAAAAEFERQMAQALQDADKVIVADEADASKMLSADEAEWSKSADSVFIDVSKYVDQQYLNQAGYFCALAPDLCSPGMSPVVEQAAAHSTAAADLAAAHADIGVAFTHVLTESPAVLLSLLP